MARQTQTPSRLRLRRLELGLRLKDVELATGIADTVLSRIERQELPLLGWRLRKLADLYGVPPETLEIEARGMR